jgi:hypothetical protein
MAQLKTHVNCRYFGYGKCPHRNDEIMKQATQTTPEYHGGKTPILLFPPHEVVDKICDNCEIFTSK